MGAIFLGLFFVLLIGPAIWLPSLLAWRFRTQTLERRGVAAMLGGRAARWLYVGLGGFVTLVGCGFICSGVMGLLLGDVPRVSHVPGRAELPEVQPTRVLADVRYSSHCVVFSPDGTRLLTGGSKLQLWDVASGSLQADMILPVREASMAYGVNKMATAHSRVLLNLFGGDPARARISHRRPDQGRWALPEQRKRNYPYSHSVDIENREAATAVPAEAAFARSGLPSDEKCGLGRWDWEEDTRQLTVVPIPIEPTALAMSADGRYAIALESHAFGSDEMRRQRRPFVVVDFQQQTVCELDEPRIGGVAFLGETHEAVLASAQGLHLLDAATHQIVREIDPPDDRDWSGCLDLSVSADGRHAVACDRKALWVWDLEAGKLAQHLAFPKKFAAELELSADGRTLVTRGFVDDGALGVWQRAGLQPQSVLVPIDREEISYIDFAISPDGRTIAAMQRDRCLLWDVAAITD